ncbi:unnamed protein product [Symbiodinium sp. KB8]|nr:unnamed protein product [Symbiodinium sp. KB8]
MLGGSVAFWFTLLFTEDFLSMTGFHHYDNFYDAACIDQTSYKQKRQGIGAITAYLWHSETLLLGRITKTVGNDDQIIPYYTMIYIL